jgi:ArsR family transcriptional regulator, arsenate/arsenite/antimonite-responsive transcriptional repressor
MSNVTLPMKRKSPPLSATSGETPAASPLKVPDRLVQSLTDVFKLLADKSRLKIVLALAQEGQMHVSALCKLLGQSQPAVSHHLTLMRMVGLVGYDRSGKHNFYYLASDHLCHLFEEFFRHMGNAEQTLELEDFSLAFSRRVPD